MFQIDRYQTVSPGLTRAKTLIFLDLYTSPERRVLLLSVFKYTGRENAFRRINHQESVAQKDVVFPAPHTRGWRDPAPDRATGRRPHEPCQLPGLRAQRPTRPPGARGLRSPREALPPGLSPPRQRRGDPCPLDRSHEATSTRLRTPPPTPWQAQDPSHLPPRVPAPHDLVLVRDKFVYVFQIQLLRHGGAAQSPLLSHSRSSRRRETDSFTPRSRVVSHGNEATRYGSGRGTNH